MTINQIPAGSLNWDVPANANFADAESRITANTASIASLTSTKANVADVSYQIPADHGVISWSFEPTSAVNAVALTAGVLQLTRVTIRAATTITNIVIGVNAAGVTLTASQNFAGLYNSAGVLLGSTADQSANWTSTGVKIMPLTGSVSAAADFYWVATLSNGTTPPQVPRSSNSPANLQNLGSTAATSFFATFGSGLTALPASFTPSALTPSQLTWWAAVS